MLRGAVYRVKSGAESFFESNGERFDKAYMDSGDDVIDHPL